MLARRRCCGGVALMSLSAPSRRRRTSRAHHHRRRRRDAHAHTRTPRAHAATTTTRRALARHVGPAKARSLRPWPSARPLREALHLRVARRQARRRGGLRVRGRVGRHPAALFARLWRGAQHPERRPRGHRRVRVAPRALLPAHCDWRGGPHVRRDGARRARDGARDAAAARRLLRQPAAPRRRVVRHAPRGGGDEPPRGGVAHDGGGPRQGRNRFALHRNALLRHPHWLHKQPRLVEANPRDHGVRAALCRRARRAHRHRRHGREGRARRVRARGRRRERGVLARAHRRRVRRRGGRDAALRGLRGHRAQRGRAQGRRHWLRCRLHAHNFLRCG